MDLEESKPHIIEINTVIIRRIEVQRSQSPLCHTWYGV